MKAYIKGQYLAKAWAHTKLFLAVAVCGLMLAVPVTAIDACTGQGGGSNVVTPVVNAVVDCTVGGNAAKIDQLFTDFKSRITSGTATWADVKHDALSAGEGIGGCAFVKLIQWYLGGMQAPPTDKANVARSTFEEYRQQVGGKTFKTEQGNL